MIKIDGSLGEGGGQIVRTCLALAMITGKAFRMDNIRSGRKRPGLLHQHLTAVLAAAKVCHARTTGAELHSRQIVFEPKEIIPGDYTFSVGTAGSSTLVLQTVLPALMMAHAPSRVVLEGGTHNSHAPPFEFIKHTFLPIISRMGPTIEVHLQRHGFYPAGGGKWITEIEPAKELAPLCLEMRGEFIKGQAKSISAHLPARIGEQEMQLVGDELGWPATVCQACRVDSNGPGNAVMIRLDYQHVCPVFTGFGAKGYPLVQVARDAVQQTKDYMAADGAADPYLADQLLLPMALAGKGVFTTLEPTLHTRTNINVIQEFLDVEIDIKRIDLKKLLVQL